MGIERCPLCGWEAEATTPGDSVDVQCQLCGKFRISRTLLSTQPSEDDKKLWPYLRAHTRQSSDRGTPAELNTTNWRQLAQAHASTRVSEKLVKFLEYVATHSQYPGDAVFIDYSKMYPLFDAVSEDEASFLAEHLINRGYLRRLGGEYHLIVTADGWARLEPPTGGGGVPGRCFIAMSFDPSLNDAYELGIRAALTGCGLSPVRVDRVHHNEKICDKILAEIRLAQFMVADFTLQRAGVYFEAGFAMGLGRTVIWTCREDELSKVHFDTRQYNHIVWTTPGELRERLTDRVRATILERW